MNGNTLRYLIQPPAAHLQRPRASLQPILAKQGNATMDLDATTAILKPIANVRPLVAVESPEHWQKTVLGLDATVDAILPMSIPAYPTEVWNSHPQPLRERGLPLIFWPLMPYNEPDFWRWSARDFLQALGIRVHIARNVRHAEQIIKAYAAKRFLASSKMVVFGDQNFPWNAKDGGHLVTESLGTKIAIRPIADIRKRYERYSSAQLQAVWQERQHRYKTTTVKPAELDQALRSYLAIKDILEEENACAFGLNCFGDLIIRGGRDVPCLAQLLLREDGYVTACDGDYIAMMSMMMITHMLDHPCMMSNMYPVSYVGALTDHFGDPLAPAADRYTAAQRPNLARLAHCGYVGIVSPEMTPSGQTVLSDWGGTYEIKRDGSGCGADGDMIPNEAVTVVELCFDGRTLLLAKAKICETTRHANMPHCESSVLMEFNNLPEFVNNISREHTAVVYGDHVEELLVLADILGLQTKVF
jgi:L-fucose isomerase-like protein